jgi:hypothetical protein
MTRTQTQLDQAVVIGLVRRVLDGAVVDRLADRRVGMLGGVLLSDVLAGDGVAVDRLGIVVPSFRTSGLSRSR